MIEQLHFLRPLWLTLLPLAALTWWLVRRHANAPATTARLIAPHLRDALTINRDARTSVQPVDGVALVMILAALIAAGPSWSRQTSPWFTESAPLVVAIELSDSMLSNDLVPTRLDRGRFKVLDLVAARPGARTALIVYAGSAHIVMPPSKDIGVLKPFLESLDPTIMPEAGANAAAVLALARELLGCEAAKGTLLFVNDGFDAGDIPALAEFAADAASPAMAALVLGTEAGGIALRPDGSPAMDARGARVDTRIDRAVLRRAAREAGVTVVDVETGDSDIRRLLRAVESNLRSADNPDARWRDEGWWFLWPALLLALGWFRRGWTMQW